MAWTVQLQDERGKPVIPDYALVEFATVPDEGSFTLLRYLDRYGDTYFNGLQMSDFIADWGKLNPLDDQRQQWKIVRDMADHCQAGPHLYLRFIGD